MHLRCCRAPKQALQDACAGGPNPGGGSSGSVLGLRCRGLTPVLHTARAGEPDDAAGELGEETALAELLSRERRLRDRSSALCVPGRSFKAVLDILEAAQVRQGGMSLGCEP